MAIGEPATIDQLQRKVSLDFLRASGAFAVEANISSKAPVAGWNPKENNRDKSEAVMAKASTDSAMNLGVHLFGDVVDVDVDSDDPLLLAALDRLLPKCGHVWGRASRPRTHRVYKLRQAYEPDKFAIMNRIKKNSHVELRGGDLSRGQYSLLPSSIHPSNEVYTWHDMKAAQATLSVTTADALVRGIRKAIAVAAIARCWTEGVRNDLALALSGFLHRVYSMRREEDDDSIVMDKEAALQFLGVVCEVANDDAKDIELRKRAFGITWDKAEKGAAVTGITRFAEITGDNAIVQLLYDMLSDSPNGEVIDRFLEKFAIRRNTTDVIDLEALASGAVRATVMPRPAFVQTYAFERVEVGGDKKRIVDLFFDIAAVKRISGIDVAPGSSLIYAKGEELMANAWAGFDVEAWSEPVSDREIEPFLDYVREVLAAGDDTRYHWLMSWIADIFQKPAERPGTSVVLVGDQGAGKSMLGYSILMPIIGRAHATATNSVDRITRSFNLNFANKIFIQCDEAINNRQKATAAKLKSLVTDPMIHIEPKGVNGWDQTNLARFLFTSNELDDAIFISDGLNDRRYAVFEVSNKRARDVTFWKAFYKWLDDKQNLSKIHKWLLGYKYKAEDIRRALTTKAKIRMVQQSMTQFDEWLSTWVSNNHPINPHLHDRFWHVLPNDGRAVDRTYWPTHVNLPLLVESYEMHCRTVRKERPEIWTEQQMRIRLADIEQPIEPASMRLSVSEYDEKKGIEIRSRPRVHRVPSMQSVKEHLTRRYGIEFASFAGEQVVEEPKTEF